MTHPIKFPKTVPAPLLLAGMEAQLYNGTGNLPVPTAVTNAGAPSCQCTPPCGVAVPLVINGNYSDPIGDGITRVNFNLTSSWSCGIPVANVLRGDLEGLVGRDEPIVLNQRANSMRLRIEWPGYEVFTSKINTPTDKFKVENLARKVCAQIEKFMAKNTTKVHDRQAAEWMVEETQVSIEQLVLVSLRRVSVGCWVPVLHLINDQNGA